MRIVIVRDRGSAGGGIFNYYQAIEQHLSVAHEFSSVGRPHAFYGARIPFGLRSTGLRLMADWLSLSWKIFQFRPDLVHLNPGLDPSVGRALRRDAVNLLTARLLGRRVLVFWRGWENSWCGRSEFPGGNRGWLCRIYKLAAAHVVLSTRFRDDLRRWGFKAPVYVETTLVANECLTALPPQFAENTVTTNLLFLSRVEAAKGVFELVDAYRILKQRNPAYTLTVAGDGPDLEALKRRVEGLGLQDVCFTGYLQGQAKVDCYRRAGIFCFLSYTEGMPNAVLEAMALGLPLVSSDAGGLRDILGDGRTGFVLSPRSDAPPRAKFDPELVANLIDRLARSRELYQRVSEYNARYARARFSAFTVAKRLESIYAAVSSGWDSSCPEGSKFSDAGPPPSSSLQNTCESELNRGADPLDGSPRVQRDGEIERYAMALLPGPRHEAGSRARRLT